jgi:hypothetical protein
VSAKKLTENISDVEKHRTKAKQEQAFALWLSKAKIACLQRAHAHKIYVVYANAHSSTLARW